MFAEGWYAETAGTVRNNRGPGRRGPQDLKQDQFYPKPESSGRRVYEFL